MQMLYAQSRDPELTLQDMLKRYKVCIDESFALYLFNLAYFLEVVSYVKEDVKRRAGKHIPSEEDKNFTPKLFENELIQSLVVNTKLDVLFAKHQFPSIIDKDLVRKLYTNFAKTDDYRAYIKQPNSTAEDHLNILLKLFKHLLADETYTEIIEDRFHGWSDEKSIIIGSFKKTLKALPAEEDFYLKYKPAEETAKDFGEVMLRHVIEENDMLLSHIEPTLKNWDADRVAILDMILIKMAITEFMVFPTVPTKVTLNEFVEIAKNYSTDKSKDFINGVLDRLMKQLEKDGKIKKEGRGLME